MNIREQELILPFVRLARDLLAGTLSIPDFEQRFFRTWGEDTVMWEEETFRVLDRFFFVVEDYVHDDSLRNPEEGDLDADQLRAGARRFLEELAAL